MPADKETQRVRLYHTAAQGWRTQLAARLAAQARARRHLRFFSLTRADARTRILDVGCGELGLRALEPSFDVTGVDLVPRPTYPGPFVQADAARALPFADGEFDLAYSNSVVEHIAPGPAREQFARELRRVSRGWFVQTPAFSFPLEPHALLPGAHWLPPASRQRYWRLGVAGEWEQIELLRRREMLALFGAPVVAERAGPLAKSWVSVRAVGKGEADRSPSPSGGPEERSASA